MLVLNLKTAKHSERALLAAEHRKSETSYVSWVRSLMLHAYIHGAEISIFRAFWPNILIWAELLMGSFHFPQWKNFFSIH